MNLQFKIPIDEELNIAYEGCEHDTTDEEAYQNSSYETTERELLYSYQSDIMMEIEEVSTDLEHPAYEVLEEEQFQLIEELEGADI